MLSLALITPNAIAAEGIEQMIHETNVCRVVYKASPELSMPEIIRNMRLHDPDLILLDLGNWELIEPVIVQLNKQAGMRGVLVGFRHSWNRLEQVTFEEFGVRDLLREPFSWAQFETVAYDALHRERPVTNQNVVAFLPSKAGGGCSTAVLNTAASLASLGKKVLLLEADRRAGILSILLNLEDRRGLPEALHGAADMTTGTWHQLYVESFGMHLLLANPARRGPLPSWAEYYHLLRFVQNQYDFICIDLPEVINQASGELVRSARGVFVVCTTEIPSLKMAGVRCAELEESEIPRDKIHVVVNRWEKNNRLSVPDVEGNLNRPVFATLPNDYKSINEAIMQSRPVAPGAPFAESCQTFARKLSGLPEAPQERSRFALLQKLGKITG